MPRWSRDGKEIFYRDSPSGSLMAVSIQSAGAGLEVGEPHALFNPSTWGLRSFYAPAPDGRRFLVNTLSTLSSGAPPQLSVIVNWPAIVRR